MRAGDRKRRSDATSIDCGDFEAKVVRRDVKNVTVRVRDDGGVTVSAPPWVSEERIASMLESKRGWISERIARLADSPHGMVARAGDEERAEWGKLVKACVPVLVEHWAPIMGVEGRVKKLAYRDMTSRWGSCQPSTGRVCINIRLAAWPPCCLEYVVVHELCHFLEPSHGPRFKALMDRFMPDWRERKDMLR